MTSKLVIRKSESTRPVVDSHFTKDEFLGHYPVHNHLHHNSQTNTQHKKLTGCDRWVAERVLHGDGAVCRQCLRTTLLLIFWAAIMGPPTWSGRAQEAIRQSRVIVLTNQKVTRILVVIIIIESCGWHTIFVIYLLHCKTYLPCSMIN